MKNYPVCNELKGNKMVNLVTKTHKMILTYAPNICNYEVFVKQIPAKTRLPYDRILNSRLIKQNNSIDIRFGSGGREKVNKFCTFLHF